MQFKEIPLKEEREQEMTFKQLNKSKIISKKN